FIPIFAFGLALSMGYVRAQMANYTISHIQLDTIEVRCKMDWVHMAWLYLTNLIMIVLTVGLAIPWAMVRVHQYRLSQMYLMVPQEGALDNFVAAAASASGATADAAADLWDLDIG